MAAGGGHQQHYLQQAGNPLIAAHYAALRAANPTVVQQQYRARVWAWENFRTQSRDINDLFMASVNNNHH